MNIKKIILISFIIFVNLFLRVWFSIYSQPQGDILVHNEWAEVLSSNGFSGSYFFQNWTYTPPTQPPLMMMAYSFSGWIYKNRNILSALHNLTKFPPAFILLGFQEYGQILSLRLWETLGTYLIASFLFFFYQKKSFKKALIIFFLIIFNPISIFINSVWGQNDILPTAFTYISFIFLFSPYFLIGLPIFLIGILFKPTVLLLTPLFGAILLYRIFTKPTYPNFIKLFFTLIICLIITYFSFKSFIPTEVEPIGYISSILHNRIATSSKGAQIASVSAFNLYSLVFNIDQTRAFVPGNLIQMSHIGILFFIIINCFFIYKFIKLGKHNFNHSLFPIYFISQGSFLFVTNMLDRYFIPAFVSSVIITVIYWKKFGFLMLIQQLVWFLNLIYAYYYRGTGLINHIFRDQNFLTIRIISFISLLIYFLNLKKYLQLTKGNLM